MIIDVRTLRIPDCECDNNLVRTKVRQRIGKVKESTYRSSRKWYVTKLQNGMLQNYRMVCYKIIMVC